MTESNQAPYFKFKLFDKNDVVIFEENYYHLDDVPTDEAVFVGASRMEINFTPAIPNTPLLYSYLEIQGDSIIYAKEKTIKIKPGFIKDILDYTVVSIKSYLPPNEQDGRFVDYFISRNERLFGLLNYKKPAAERDFSWSATVATLALVGIASTIRNEKSKKNTRAVKKIQNNVVETSIVVHK